MKRHLNQTLNVPNLGAIQVAVTEHTEELGGAVLYVVTKDQKEIGHGADFGESMALQLHPDRRGKGIEIAILSHIASHPKPLTFRETTIGSLHPSSSCFAPLQRPRLRSILLLFYLQVAIAPALVEMDECSTCIASLGRKSPYFSLPILRF